MQVSWRLLWQRHTLSAASAGAPYCYIRVRILRYICVLILRYICVRILTAHTVCGFRRCAILLHMYMCPHTTVYMCPHTPVYMCSHTDGTHCLRLPQCAGNKKAQPTICVLILLYICVLIRRFNICVLILLLYTCVLTLLCLVCATRTANESCPIKAISYWCTRP
jgi:hypothetical protein